MFRSSSIAWLFALACVACGRGSGNGYPYGPNETRVIGAPAGDLEPDGHPAEAHVPGVRPLVSASTSGSKLCLDEGAQCETPAMRCGDHATADVVVDPGGDVLTIVCYPDDGYAVVPLEGEGAAELGDDVVAVVDGRDDGVDFDGDLLIEDDDVIVYGDGPETSVIGGNVEIIGNDAIVHGVRIQGDAIFRENDAALVDCVIEGKLTIVGDHTTVALCEVWGDVVIDGDGAVLVSNLIAGDQQVDGANLRCNDNHRFTDIEGDGAIEKDDVLGPVNCVNE